MLQEEALLIKYQLAKRELEGFNISKGWLESFKEAHEIHEYWIKREGEDVLLVTVKTWLERLPGIVKDYEPCNQLNMDELGLCFETLPNKGLADKKKSLRGGK